MRWTWFFCFGGCLIPSPEQLQNEVSSSRWPQARRGRREVEIFASASSSASTSPAFSLRELRHTNRPDLKALTLPWDSIPLEVYNSVHELINEIFDGILDPQLNSAFKGISDLPTLHRLASILVFKTLEVKNTGRISINTFSMYVFSLCSDRSDLIFLLGVCDRISLYGYFRSDLWRLFSKLTVLPFMLQHVNDNEILILSVRLLKFTTVARFCSYYARQMDSGLIDELELSRALNVILQRLCPAMIKSLDFQYESDSEGPSSLMSILPVIVEGPDSDDEAEEFELSVEIGDTVTL